MPSPYREAALELGELLSVHKERSFFLLGLIAGFLALVTIGYAFFSGVPASIAIEMVLVILVGVGALWKIGKRNPQGRIELFERGIVSHSRRGKRTIRFDDVKSITTVKSRRRRRGIDQQMHIVQAKDGTKIGFTLIYDDAFNLIDAIEAATHDRLRSEALKAYDAGEIVRFGPLAISEEGFFDGDRPVVAWSDIERATIEVPQLASSMSWTEIKVWKKGESAPISVQPSERVPNADVLVEIILLAIKVENEEAGE